MLNLLYLSVRGAATTLLYLSSVSLTTCFTLLYLRVRDRHGTATRHDCVPVGRHCFTQLLYLSSVSLTTCSTCARAAGVVQAQHGVPVGRKHPHRHEDGTCDAPGEWRRRSAHLLRPRRPRQELLQGDVC
jgi:hypothetical protein